jgi:hypothetical protein
VSKAAKAVKAVPAKSTQRSWSERFTAARKDVQMAVQEWHEMREHTAMVLREAKILILETKAEMHRVNAERLAALAEYHSVLKSK